MTWFKDLEVPESFGFLRNQATPFSIKCPAGGALFAWHILPIELYRQHESALVAEPSGFISDMTSRYAFTLLRGDPEARLVIHFHGAAGTVGSGYRVPNYRALSAGNPNKIHVLTFDYRGFGRSPGTPSERGLILDALAVVDWATHVAGVPSSRILIFGQSLGTAVSLAVSEHFALQSPPVIFAGTVLVAPFLDVATLVSTYRLTIIHAEDDYDIPWHHSELVFWHAINATTPRGINYNELEELKIQLKTNLGAAGSVVEWRTENGIIREEILKTGLHDVVMGNPVVTMAVMRIFEAANPRLE
ncbi:MAG: hypothetical protein Q9191_001882 [Dirinaria sp. TL-2023a]